MSASSITSTLLESLLSPDGNIRSQAENVYQSVPVTDRIPVLLPQISAANGGTSPVSHLAAVLLRRDIVKLDNSQQLTELVSPLLQLFQTCQSSVQVAVGHCLAQVCASLSMVQAATSSSVLTTILSTLQPFFHQGHLPSLQLLAALADKSPCDFSKVAANSLPALYRDGWAPASLAVWVDVLVNSAVATTVQYPSLEGVAANANKNLDELTIDTNSEASKLAPSLMPPLQLLTSSSASDETHSQEILQQLAHAAVSCPSFLAGNVQVLQTLVQTCLQIATSEAFSSSLQLSALQVLASLVSVGDIKRRVLPSNLATAIATSGVTQCVQLMASNAGDKELDLEWAQDPATLLQPEDSAMDDELDDYLFAMSLLETFVSQLGALPVLLPLAETLLQSPQTQRTALAVLECAVLASPVTLTPHLPVLVQAASTLVKNGSTQSDPSSSRIQYQGIRLLGALCATHQAFVLEQACQVVLECFAIGGASPISKVSTTACLGLVSFCRGDGTNEQTAEALTPFVNDLLTVLVQAPLSITATDPGSIAVRVRAMGATACLAQSIGQEFAPYYSTIVPGLLATISHPSANTDLIGAAMEAVTIIGQAGGKELFVSDAQKVLQWILPALQGVESGQCSPALVEPFLLACARIASVLEEDFAQHVDAILPLLLSRAQQTPEVSITEGTEGDMDSLSTVPGMESMTVAVPGRGFTKVSINTTKIQEQSQAIRALYELTKALGVTFGPYVERCMETALPLISFPYSADVRGSSAQTVAAIFEAACLAGEEIGMALPQKYLPLAANAIAKQIAHEDTTDMEALYALADSLSEVYYIVYRNRNNHPEILSNFTLTNAQESIQFCRVAMVVCLERRAQITEVLSGVLSGEDEKEAYSVQMKSEQQLLTPLVDSVGYTLKFFRQALLPHFEQHILSLLSPKLVDLSDIRASIAAICLYDDIVEHCGVEAAGKFAPTLEKGIVAALEQDSNDLELIQAAVYGIVQIARHTPQVIPPADLTTFLKRLLELTNKSKEEIGDFAYVAELAASAIASLTLLGPYRDLNFVPRERLVSAYLSHLPVLHDDDEANICHAGLCHLVQSGVVSLEHDALQLLRIFGQILLETEEGEELASADTLERIVHILHQMKQDVPAATMQQLFGNLNPDAQRVLMAAMSH